MANPKCLIERVWLGVARLAVGLVCAPWPVKVKESVCTNWRRKAMTSDAL